MISNSFVEEMTSLFGEDVLKISMEFNRNGRFTDDQVETIESTCREMLYRAHDRRSQRQFIEELDWQRSCLFCAWVIRGSGDFFDF